MSLLEQLQTALAGRYAVEQELGHGGMALVFLAQDLKHHRPVAIKVLRPELTAALGAERFLREIAIAARLTHPHILAVHDSGEGPGLLYYVMPYVEGESLRERLTREKQLPVDDAVRIARQVAGALGYAHSHNVVHRDIKPENILLQSGHAVVADFGIARAITAAGGDRLTTTGISVGTPAYMSPEQAAGEPVDGRTDVYSLGCVLYEMLAGEPPYTGATAQAIQARRLTDPVPPLRTVRETVPTHVEQAIVKALAKVPADRFASATQLAEAMERLHDAPEPVHLVQQVRRRTGALVGLLAAVVILGAIWWILTSSNAPISSLVVLPLHNISGDHAQAYFAEAVHEAIIGELGKIGALRTISPWSSSRYRDTDKSIQEIARELGVNAVVQGSVYSVGGRVRLQVQLVQVGPSERLLWSNTYDGDIRDVLTLQTNVARAVADRIRVTLTPLEEASLARAQPVDQEAYDAYARGRFAWNKYTAAGLREAVDYFQEAIDKDPNYALAYAGLADAYCVLPYYAAVDPGQAFPKARAAATKALELDSTLAEAYSALGWTAAVYEWDWPRAEEYHRRALALNPSYAVGHMRYAWFLAWVGRFDEAIAVDLRARQLDPLSPRIMAHLGIVHQVARQYDRAIELYQETLARYPNFARARWDLGRAYLDKGQYQQAVAELQEATRLSGRSDAGSTNSQADLAGALAQAGRRSDALQILQDLEEERKRRYGSALNIAKIYVALGDHEQAIGWLQRAYETRDADMVLLKVLPAFDPVRADPRFQNLLRRIGFPN